jgi:DNA-directed RNA polymerase specialized sigma24 family protein
MGERLRGLTEWRESSVFERFERGTNFKAWHFRILVLSAKNEGRAQRKQPVALGDETARGHAAQESENGRPAALGRGTEFLNSVAAQF